MTNINKNITAKQAESLQSSISNHENCSLTRLYNVLQCLSCFAEDEEGFFYSLSNISLALDVKINKKELVKKALSEHKNVLDNLEILLERLPRNLQFHRDFLKSFEEEAGL